MSSELRLPAAPVKEILHRAGLRVTPDAVDTARAMAEDAIEAAGRRAAEEMRAKGCKTIDGDHLATWWGVVLRG